MVQKTKILYRARNCNEVKQREKESVDRKIFLCVLSRQVHFRAQNSSHSGVRNKLQADSEFLRLKRTKHVILEYTSIQEQLNSSYISSNFPKSMMFVCLLFVCFQERTSSEYIRWGSKGMTDTQHFE